MCVCVFKNIINTRCVSACVNVCAWTLFMIRNAYTCAWIVFSIPSPFIIFISLPLLSLPLLFWCAHRCVAISAPTLMVRILAFLIYSQRNIQHKALSSNIRLHISPPSPTSFAHIFYIVYLRTRMLLWLYVAQPLMCPSHIHGNLHGNVWALTLAVGHLYRWVRMTLCLWRDRSPKGLVQSPPFIM